MELDGKKADAGLSTSGRLSCQWVRTVAPLGALGGSGQVASVVRVDRAAAGTFLWLIRNVRDQWVDPSYLLNNSRVAEITVAGATCESTCIVFLLSCSSVPAHHLLQSGP